MANTSNNTNATDASHSVLLMATRGHNLDKAGRILPRICAGVIHLEIFPVEMTSEVLREGFYTGKPSCGRNRSRFLRNVKT